MVFFEYGDGSSSCNMGAFDRHRCIQKQKTKTLPDKLLTPPKILCLFLHLFCMLIMHL